MPSSSKVKFFLQWMSLIGATGIPLGQKGASSTVTDYPQVQAPVLSGILASLVVF